MKGKNSCNLHNQSFAAAPQRLPLSLLVLSLGQRAIACSSQFSYLIKENVCWLYSYSAASIYGQTIPLNCSSNWTCRTCSPIVQREAPFVFQSCQSSEWVQWEQWEAHPVSWDQHIHNTPARWCSRAKWHKPSWRRLQLMRPCGYNTLLPVFLTFWQPSRVWRHNVIHMGNPVGM